MTTGEKIGVLVSYVVGAVLWISLWWYVASKMGYRGKFRWVWAICMCIPPLIPFTMLLIFLLPWPVHGEKRNLKKQMDVLQVELDEARAQGARNVEYIKLMNIKVQKLENQLINRS